MIELEALVGEMPKVAGDAEFLAVWGPIRELTGEKSEFGEGALLDVMRDAGALQAGTIDPAWGGSWRWDMSSGVAKSVLASGLISAVLVAGGVSGLLPLVVPAVMPLLFELNKVRLTRNEDKIISIIGARKDAFEHGGTPHQLYASLPTEVRESLKEHEFQDFVDAAIDAGLAIGDGDVVQILSTGESVFRLKIL